MTNAELNEAVARKLGWLVSGPEYYAPPKDGSNRWPVHKTLPAYSTSIEAAWEILEALKTPFSMHIYRMTNLEYRCVLQPTDIQARADTAPLAIVKAFLKLKGAE